MGWVFTYIVSPSHEVGGNAYMIGSTTAVGVNVSDADQGANIVSRTLGVRSLQVRVHSWHNAYVAVRIYCAAQSGNACSLPPFTYREL